MFLPFSCKLRTEESKSSPLNATRISLLRLILSSSGLLKPKRVAPCRRHRLSKGRVWRNPAPEAGSKWAWSQEDPGKVCAGLPQSRKELLES